MTAFPYVEKGPTFAYKKDCISPAEANADQLDAMEEALQKTGLDGSAIIGRPAEREFTVTQAVLLQTYQEDEKLQELLKKEEKLENKMDVKFCMSGIVGMVVGTGFGAALFSGHPVGISLSSLFGLKVGFSVAKNLNEEDQAAYDVIKAEELAHRQQLRDDFVENGLNEINNARAKLGSGLTHD